MTSTPGYKFQDRLQFFTGLNGNTNASGSNEPSTLPRSLRGSKEGLSGVSGGVGGVKSGLSGARSGSAGNLSGGSYTTTSASAAANMSNSGASEFMSVRDRIVRANATTSSANTGGSTHSLNSNNGAESYHPAPQRVSQTQRAAPYPRRASGGRVSVGSRAQALATQPASQSGMGDMDVDAGTTTTTTTVATRKSQENLSSISKSGATAATNSSSNKCFACNKTVYVMDQIAIDNHVFHKTCFKCAHCKGTLKMGNLASLDGQYYCKPHFKQLFKLKGNYSEGFGKEEPKRAWLNEHGTAAK